MLLISALFVHTRPARAEDVPIKVGVILPLTGDFAFFGEQAKLGIEVALTELIRYSIRDSAMTAYTSSLQ